jgi:hypothetical protein
LVSVELGGVLRDILSLAVASSGDGRSRAAVGLSASCERRSIYAHDHALRRVDDSIFICIQRRDSIREAELPPDCKYSSFEGIP